MTVYVDQLMATQPKRGWPYRYSCHMFADSVEELHKFAKSIGMKRIWFQDHLLPHYDLTMGRRLVAIAKGAESVTMKFVGEFIKKNNKRRWRNQRGIT